MAVQHRIFMGLSRIIIVFQEVDGTGLDESKVLSQEVTAWSHFHWFPAIRFLRCLAFLFSGWVSEFNPQVTPWV